MGDHAGILSAVVFAFVYFCWFCLFVCLFVCSVSLFVCLDGWLVGLINDLSLTFKQSRFNFYGSQLI